MPPEQPETEVQLEIGHVLFIDIVGYSKALIDDQRALQQDLNDVVRQTEQFRIAEAAGRTVIGTRWVASRHNPTARCSQISACGERFWSGATSRAGSKRGVPRSSSASSAKKEPMASISDSACLLPSATTMSGRPVACHNNTA